LTLVVPCGQTLAVPPYQSNVREYRQKAGLSQEGLARELGVSRQTVVNIEKGLSEPKVLLAIALGAILGVALEELFRKGTT
jgi:putative transcriptional regulator